MCGVFCLFVCFVSGVASFFFFCSRNSWVLTGVSDDKMHGLRLYNNAMMIHLLRSNDWVW
jgi:hypothetical protein